LGGDRDDGARRAIRAFLLPKLREHPRVEFTEPAQTTHFRDGDDVVRAFVFLSSLTQMLLPVGVNGRRNEYEHRERPKVQQQVEPSATCKGKLFGVDRLCADV